MVAQRLKPAHQKTTLNNCCKGEAGPSWACTDTDSTWVLWPSAVTAGDRKNPEPTTAVMEYLWASDTGECTCSWSCTVPTVVPFPKVISIAAKMTLFRLCCEYISDISRRLQVAQSSAALSDVWCFWSNPVTQSDAGAEGGSCCPAGGQVPWFKWAHWSQCEYLSEDLPLSTHKIRFWLNYQMIVQFRPKEN